MRRRAAIAEATCWALISSLLAVGVAASVTVHAEEEPPIDKKAIIVALPQDEDEASTSVSYVVEPFEAGVLQDLDYYFKGGTTATPSSIALNVSTTSEHAYVGNRALRVEYPGQVEPTVVELESHLPSPQVHNLQGAHSMSFWYQYHYLYINGQEQQEDEESSVDIKFFLQESNSDLWWDYLPDLALIANTNNERTSWKEMLISLVPSAWRKSESNTTTTSTTTTLQLDRIQAWRIELHSGSAAQGTASFLLDHLIAVGNENLVEALLHAKQEDSAHQEQAVLAADGVLQMVPNTPYPLLAPSRAYYNFSQARALALYYVISNDESSTLRFWLLENNNTHCTTGNGCSSNSSNHNELESYHSFYELPPIGQGIVAVDLEWDESKGFGNHQLDKDHIKGIRLEWATRKTTTTAQQSGEMYLRHLRAIGSTEYAEMVHANEMEGTSQCIVHPELQLVPDSTFRRLQGATDFAECCLSCQEDSSCIYATMEKDGCFYTDYVPPETLQLGSIQNNSKNNSQLFVNDRHRGDFCELCQCRQDRHNERLVDCQGADLTILPKLWSKEWAPRVLDLTNNPHLTILMSSELPLAYLEEIRLPGNLTYLDPAVAQSLPQHCNIAYEDDQTPHLMNAITRPSDVFSNVCCGKAQPIYNNGLQFCNLESDYPGVDASYEPFVRYHADDYIAEITPSSSFLFEAASSAEKCAAFCNLDANCGYFTYDNRYELSEPTCYLMKEILGAYTMEEQYADEDRSRSGFVSGQVARTRCKQEDAHVIIETSTSKHLVVSELDGFEAHYNVRLGAMPLRGAVWVEPKMQPSTANEGMVQGPHGHEHMHAHPALDLRDGIEIRFSPSRLVLYDNETVATVHVIISVGDGVELSKDDTLIIENEVEACDHAFSSSASCVTSEELSVFLHVVSGVDTADGGTSVWAPIVATLAIAVFLGALAVLHFLTKTRRRADAAWKVDVTELHFGDPPEVLGRGSFGLVLLAEYRGTQVAVKKVLKSEKDYGGGTSTMFSSFFNPSDHSVHPFESTPPADLESGLIALDKSTLNNSSHASNAKKQKDVSQLKQFVREMRQLNKLRHPCISSLMGAIIERGMVPMIVMEYMDQGSLYDLLHNETVILENEQLVPILRDITKGMRFLHASDPSVVHGDLKAQNVLVDNKFRAKVADFGFTQKKCMGVTGTPYWLAPEILRCEASNNTASDVYSFGILLFEVLSRKEPYEGEDFESVLLDVVHGDKRPPVVPSSTIPIQTMYLECVDGNPSDRPSFATLDNKMKSMEALTIETSEQKEGKIAMSITLSDIFPQHIAEALQRGEKIEPQHHDIVTIFFSDIVGFTTISQSLSPLKVSHMLDRLYHRFDELSQKHEVFKVETIGDAWMGVTNLIKEQPDHVKRIARFAIDARKAASDTLIDTEDPDLGCVEIRVGFHAGPVVSNVVGSRNPRFCLFGDTVNTASRMESTSENGKIHCSAISAELLQQQDPELHLSARGRISIKGKGDMFTFFVYEEVPPEEQSNGLSVSFNTRHANTGILDSSFKELMKSQRMITNSASTRMFANTAKSSSYRGSKKDSPRRSKSFETNERGRRFSAYR